MVQTDIPQLARECSGWRDTLRSQRDHLNTCKNQLQQLANRPLSKEQLAEVEHFHNQFHIQLINVHDLKQLIKAHDRKVNFESETNQGQLSEETLQDHESLNEQYGSLQATLQELTDSFDAFSRRTQ